MHSASEGRPMHSRGCTGSNAPSHHQIGPLFFATKWSKNGQKWGFYKGWGSKMSTFEGPAHPHKVFFGPVWKDLLLKLVVFQCFDGLIIVADFFSFFFCICHFRYSSESHTNHGKTSPGSLLSLQPGNRERWFSRGNQQETVERDY